MTDDPVAWLQRQLRRSLHGQAWHGPSLLEAVHGVSWADAVATPIDGAHSIADLVHHATGWMEEVERRLDGTPPAMPARGDWPAQPPGDDAAWGAWVAALQDSGASLLRALEQFPAARLPEQVGGGTHDAPLGSGVTYATMLNGVVQHNVYHAGQIVLLRKLL